MADVFRTRAELESDFADNDAKQITAQRLRNFLKSTIVIADGDEPNGSGYEILANKNSPSGYVGLDGNGNLVVEGGVIPMFGTSDELSTVPFPSGNIATTTDTHQILLGLGDDQLGGKAVGFPSHMIVLMSKVFS